MIILIAPNKKSYWTIFTFSIAEVWQGGFGDVTSMCDLLQPVGTVMISSSFKLYLSTNIQNIDIDKKS